MDDSLHRFVHEALGRGIPRAQIERTLLAAGWPKDEVRNALDRYAEVDFPLPVPRPKPYLSAREAFIYLVLFTLLYLAAWSFGSLLFQFINKAYPDLAANRRAFSFDALRWAVAMLLIAFPGFFLLARRVYASARRDPERRKSKVRKWLTYLTLFLAAGVLLGDLITLVFNLLEGELTTRFLLKVLSVGAIAGSIFGYYFWDLKQDDLEPEATPKHHPWLRVFAGCLLAAVTASLVVGFVIAGSPGRARREALDDRRQQSLVQIANAIDYYWSEEKALPAELQTVKNMRGVYIQSIHDPATGAPFEYTIRDESSYELCAVFEAASEHDEVAPAYRNISDFWRHEAGRTCFDVEVKTSDD